MKKVLACMLVLLLGVAVISGCSSTPNAETPTGKYYIIELTDADGTELVSTAADLGMDTEANLYVDFIDDSHCTMYVFDSEMELTFSIKGDNITFVDSSNARSVGVIDGDTIRIEDPDGTVMVLQKAK
ncbi:MAG: hypothetical protein FWH40_03745 [Coriobacteriia bacterium]|nr:hypothetical protein [Coriobacteriia bacterium]